MYYSKPPPESQGGGLFIAKDIDLTGTLTIITGKAMGVVDVSTDIILNKGEQVYLTMAG